MKENDGKKKLDKSYTANVIILEMCLKFLFRLVFTIVESAF